MYVGSRPRIVIEIVSSNNKKRLKPTATECQLIFKASKSRYKTRR